MTYYKFLLAALFLLVSVFSDVLLAESEMAKSSGVDLQNVATLDANATKTLCKTGEKCMSCISSNDAVSADDNIKLGTFELLKKYQIGIVYFLTVLIGALVFTYKHARLLQSYREQARHYGAYLDTIGISVIVIDRNGKTTRVNPAGCTLLGDSKENVLKNFFFDTYLDPDDREYISSIFTAITSDDYLVLESHEQINNSYECGIIRPDGSVRVVSWLYTTLRDKNGRVEEILACGEDITEKKQTEELLKQSTDKNIILGEYETAFTKNSIVSKTDINGKITYVNEKFCEISGYSNEELIGKSHSIVRHLDMPSEVFGQMWKIIKQKQIWQGRVTNKRKDGSKYIVNAMIMPILDSRGEIKEFLSVREDVTSLVELGRKLEEEKIVRVEKEMVAKSAADVSKAKDAFLVVFTHELKTPLNAIINFSKYISKQIAKSDLKDKDELSDLASRIQYNGDNMLETVNNILDISRLRANKIVFKHENVNPSSIIEDIISLNGATIKEKCVVVERDMDMAMTIVSDKQRFSQIVSNLISNAIKYGEGKILVSLSHTADNFVLSIEDNGRGIHDKENAFELFSSAQNDLADFHGGTGIGLNFTRELCSGMGFDIRLEDSSALGGAKFTVSKIVKREID